MSGNPQDPWKDPAWLEYERRAREELSSMIQGSALGMAFVEGGEIEPQAACELGYLIMMNKPIIALVSPGVKVPEKLVKVADEIVEGFDMNDPECQERIGMAVARIKAKLGGTA